VREGDLFPWGADYFFVATGVAKATTLRGSQCHREDVDCPPRFGARGHCGALVWFDFAGLPLAAVRAVIIRVQRRRRE
jgi:hypothetical protein